MSNSKYGTLLKVPIKLQRQNFSEMCRLLGVRLKYSYPLAMKDYTLQGELTSDYSDEESLWAIFNENVDQRTAKLLGWNAETLDRAVLVSVPFDTYGLQIGCRFSIPSALDNGTYRLFRVTKLSTIQMYPASITCECVPEYESIVDKADTELFVNTDFNLLYQGDGDEN